MRNIPGRFFSDQERSYRDTWQYFHDKIAELRDTEMGKGIKLNPSNWKWSEGVSKTYSGRGTGHSSSSDFEYSRLVLAFAERGSTIFRGNDPEAFKIMNWEEIQQSLIIKMTQVLYSFRELYVVTESVSLSQWTLAIAGAEKAELEIATEADNFGLVDIFGHESARTIQSKDIECNHHENRRKPAFFKAKKLAVVEGTQGAYISRLLMKDAGEGQQAAQLNHDDAAAPTPQKYDRTSMNLLDILPANELNPGTALRYFRWENAGMDDIEKLFLNYGN